MMALALELETLPGIRYKVDTNHDIVYMEFHRQRPRAFFAQRAFQQGGVAGALRRRASSRGERRQEEDPEAERVRSLKRGILAQRLLSARIEWA